MKTTFENDPEGRSIFDLLHKSETGEWVSESSTFGACEFAPKVELQESNLLLQEVYYLITSSFSVLLQLRQRLQIHEDRLQLIVRHVAVTFPRHMLRIQFMSAGRDPRSNGIEKLFF